MSARFVAWFGFSVGFPRRHVVKSVLAATAAFALHGRARRPRHDRRKSAPLFLSRRPTPQRRALPDIAEWRSSEFCAYPRARCTCSGLSFRDAYKPIESLEFRFHDVAGRRCVQDRRGKPEFCHREFFVTAPNSIESLHFEEFLSENFADLDFEPFGRNRFEQKTTSTEIDRVDRALFIA